MANSFVEVKKAFFDKTKVIRMMDRKTRKVLNRFGGVVRKHAQQSMRSRKKVSSPGSPPHAHAKLLKKHLYYLYDEKLREVVIGPILLNKTANLKVPKTLEAGGDQARATKKGVIRVYRYRARPYMHPAFKTYIVDVAKWYAETQ